MTTPFVCIMFKTGMENKQCGISFEIGIYSQTKLQLQKKFHSFCFIFLIQIYIIIQINSSLNN